MDTVKRLLEINVVCGVGSTGRIAVDIAKEYEKKGYEVKIAYGRKFVPEDCKRYAIRVGNKADNIFHGIKSRIFDGHGLGSVVATKRFLRWATKFNPDVLWLHNIHGYYINYELLFKWIKSRPHMEVKWTLHDCWAFTGHCTHFTEARCFKWVSKCYSCAQKRKYPSSLFDFSKCNYEKKRKSFTNCENIRIIVPSKWLLSHVKNSFLCCYEIEVMPNSVNLDIFKPKPTDFREKYGVSYNKKLLLGVASVWTMSKGLADLIEIYNLLDKDKYKMVIVGLTKKQISKLPMGIIGMSRVDINTLSEIYNAADLYINPSKEETYGLTTLEALSFGTKAIVYEGTACEEVAIENGGVVVEQNTNALLQAIYRMT